MAAEYEVNIKLNTQQVEQQLKTIDTRTKRTGRMATENINALAKAQDRRARLMNKINELESKGLNVVKLRKQMGKATEELAKRRFGSLQQEFRLLEKTLRLEESKLRILRQQRQGLPSSPLRGATTTMGSPAQIAASARAGGPRSPIGGAANIAGSPAALAANRKRLEQVGLGAGFPLLFGGGAGAVLGGGLGGLTGSFGAQIALSAAGQLVDQFVGNVIDAGKAFGSLNETLNLMRDRSLFTSKESEELARKLEKLGDVEGLAELATAELASKIGSEGIKAFQDLETEVDEFDRLVANLIISLQAFLAGPLASFLNVLNATLGKQITRGTVDRLAASLTDPEGRKRFKAEAVRQIGTQVDVTGFGFGGISGLPRTERGLKPASLDVLSDLTRRVSGGEEFGPSTLLSQKLKITQKDRDLIKPKPPKPTRDRAAEEERRLQQRLAALELERQKIIEVSRFKDKIAAAEAASDSQLVIRLQGEQRKAEIESKRLKDLVKVTDQREIDLINITAATKQLAETREIERQLAEDQRKKKEFFDETVQGLEHQLELVQATSEAERDRLRIEEKLRKLREDGMPEEQVSQIGGLMRQISEENSPLNRFIKQSTESLNDLESHAVRISEGIGNAIGNSLVSGMQNLITGAQSVKEVFADMLKSIADVLAQQAAQMIATYIAVGIARAFGLGGGGGGGGAQMSNTQYFNPMTGLGVAGPNFGLAEGGFVDRPTNALIGEGGEPEYVIPESKMRESMARYSRGSRGASVIPGGDGDATTGEGGIAVAAPIDVRYTVERINSVDYVTADQFQRGMQSAATQGAKQGEQNTLKRLQMSSSTRKRLGM